MDRPTAKTSAALADFMFKYAPVGRGGEFLADAFELISIAVKESSEYVDSLIEAEMMNATERKNR